MDTHEDIPESAGTSEITEQNLKISSSSTKQHNNKALPFHMITWLFKWFQANTFAPGFLSGTWSQPIFGYVVACAGQLVMVIGLLALFHSYPLFRFLEGPLILFILLVALGWGAGPGIVALLVGAVLLIFFVFPPTFSFSFGQSSDVIELLLYIVVGLTISILSSNNERARRTSEQLRLRLDTIIDAIPDAIVLYDLQGRRTQQNRVAREMGNVENPPLSVEEMPGQLAIRRAGGEPFPFEALPLVRALRGETVIGAELLYRVPVKQQDRLVSISSAPLYAPSSKTIEGAVTITHDLTEHKRIEDALRASEERYRTIVQTANEGIWLIDTEARTLYANNRMAELLDVNVKDMFGHTVLEFVYPEDQSDGYSHIRSNLLGNYEQFDFRFRRIDGRPLHTLACTSPIRNEEGTIIGALGMYTDMTERKRAAEQEQFLARVNKVLNSSLDYHNTLTSIAQLIVPKLADWFAIDLVNAEGQFELVEVYHKDPAQVQWAKTLREKYPIDPKASTGAPRVVRSGQSELYSEITGEMLIASIQNEEELTFVRQMDVSSMMLVPLIASGRIIGVISFVSTELGRKFHEHDLALTEEIGRRAGVAIENARLYRDAKQARDQLNIILQGVADGIIVHNKDGQIIYANEAATQLTGYALIQAMMETSPLGFLSKYELIDEQGNPFPHSQLTHRLVFAGKQEAQATVGYRNTTTRHPERWTFVKSRSVYDEQGEANYAITIIHDITESFEQQQRKDEFISMASHELKTPVTSLKGFTNVLQRRLSHQGDEQTLHYLSRIDFQLYKLTKIINDLLDISKMQAGQLSSHNEPFDLDSLIRGTVEDVQAATLSHQFLIEGVTGMHISGDKDRLEQVFVNLLTNAVKYSPKTDKVLVSLSHTQEEAIICVKDFGIGIDDVHHQKIFERFYQVTDPLEKTYPGLGMGLYISHEIVNRHHGRMWVESRKGEGATFYVALPVLQVDNLESPGININ